MHPRTHIMDVVGAQPNTAASNGEVKAILECSLEATQAAIDNRDPILDWTESENAKL